LNGKGILPGAIIIQARTLSFGCGQEEGGRREIHSVGGGKPKKKLGSRHSKREEDHSMIGEIEGKKEL